MKGKGKKKTKGQAPAQQSRDREGAINAPEKSVAPQTLPVQPETKPLQPESKSAGNGFSIPAQLAAEIDEVITHYPVKRSASLMVLHALQEQFGYLSREAIEWTAAKLELQPINVYELVTFYPMFRQDPAGKYVLKVCRTLSCALGGSYQLHEHLCKKLGLDAHAHGAQTTRDGKFTVEFVECLASCGTAPVMMCNESFYEGVSHERAEEILKECK